jgi:hypothetical protein
MLSTAFCVALLAAAAAAFALTEGAKTGLSPIFGTKIDKVFSPTCEPRICGKRVADIDFALRGRERLQVWMESGGKRVATIVAGRSYPRGKVRLAFDGRAPDGAVLPDGIYIPVVRLVGDHRTITLPNQITLDTRAPQVRHVPHDLRKLISPGSVGEPGLVLVPYTLSARGHGILFVDGRRVSFTYRQPLHGVLQWNGTLAGQPAPPGRYTLEIAVQDEAGNRSKPIRVGEVTVRYLKLSPTRIVVRRRARFSIAVVIGPARVTYLFHGVRSSTGSRRLRLRAPKARGRYRLYVEGAGHGASALVVVR